MDNQVIHNDLGLIDLLYRFGEFPDVLYEPSNETEKYTRTCAEHLYDSNLPNNIPKDHDADTWFIPDEYYEIDLEEYFINKCTTEQQIARVREELTLFENRQITNLIRLVIYIVDFLENNNIVTGVGRGSSVSCFLFYLAGLHFVNPLEHDLDITEFLR